MNRAAIIADAPDSRTSNTTRNTLINVGLFCCICLILFMVAAAIVLALIPVYISNRSAQDNSTPKRSEAASFQIAADIDDPTSTSGRRRRDLSSYINANVSSDNHQQFREKLIANLPRSIFKDLVIDNVTVFNVIDISTTARKYSALIKRQVNGNQRKRIGLLVFYYIIYLPGCSSLSCQNGISSTLNTRFTKIPTQTFSFTNIRLVSAGETVTLTTVTLNSGICTTKIRPVTPPATVTVPTSPATVAPGTIASTTAAPVCDLGFTRSTTTTTRTITGITITPTGQSITTTGPGNTTTTGPGNTTTTQTQSQPSG